MKTPARFVFLNIFIFLASDFALAQERLPGVFTYQGRAYQADGTTPLTGNATFSVQIRSSDGNCLLYQESHTGVDLTASNGLFALNIGDGTAKSGLALDVAFSNLDQPKTTLSGTCGGTYTPANLDARVLRITVDTGAPVALDDQYIYSVPKALVADSLNGYTYQQFMQHLTTAQRNALTSMVNGTTIYNSDNGRFERYNGAIWVAAFALAGDGTTISGDGTSGNEFAVIPGGIDIATLTGELTFAQLPTGCSDNEILKMNGASWNCEVDAGTDGLTVVATDGTTIDGDGDATPIFLMDDAVTSAKIDDATIATVDLADDAVTAAKLADSAIDAVGKIAAGLCGASQVLRKNAGNNAWECVTLTDDNTTYSAGAGLDLTTTTFSIGTGEVVTAMIANDAITFDKVDLHASCGIGELLTVNAGGTAWECAPPKTLIHIADADNDTKVQVEEAADEDMIRFDTAGTERMVINNTGNISMGPIAPIANAKLVVQGAAVSRTNIIAAGATVNLSLGNTHLLKAPATNAITLQNITDGGVYTLVVSDTTPRMYTFSGCDNSYFSPDNTATSDRSTYTIMAIDDGGSMECYITWTTDFN